MRNLAWIISKSQANQALGVVLRKQFALSHAKIRQLASSGGIAVEGRPCANLGRRLRPGQRLEIRPQRKTKSAPASGVVIRFADAHIVVVDKPVGITTVRHAHEAAEFGARAQRYLPATLADRLPALLTDGKSTRVRAVHRIDRDTSGLVIFARSPEAESRLGERFRAHALERRYLALVRGTARSGRIESYLVSDRGDGRRGSTPQPGQGKRAVTHVKVIERLSDYTLIECRLETGRTHQVRIHLGEAGTPLCGDRVYDRPVHGRPVGPDESGMTRPALHAAYLGLQHPITGKRLSWTSPLPADMKRAVGKVGGKR